MINVNLLKNMIPQFRQNPMQVLNQKFRIPQNIQRPEDIAQYLLNTGQVNQQQVNAAMQMRNNPQIQNLFR